MSLFTFDDLEEMYRAEREFFGPEPDELQTPDQSSTDTIIAYSRSVSIRPSSTLGFVQHHLN